MNDNHLIIDKSVKLLLKLYDPKKLLFSSSSRCINDKIINNFNGKEKFRNTIIVLNSLQKLEYYRNIPWDIELIINNYLKYYIEKDLNIGNRGLLLNILSIRKHKYATELFNWLVYKLTKDKMIYNCTTQDISWCLLGFSSYAIWKKDQISINYVKSIVKYINNYLIYNNTFLPKNDNSFRGNFISFGALAYFLMALEYYFTNFDDKLIEKIFLSCTNKMLDIQGINGEWPWFIDSSTGKIMDWYQIYSVHQSSMSMFFLLPAFNMGIKGAFSAIKKSFNWLIGNNQLNSSMIQYYPFHIYRSIRRKSIFSYHSFERFKRIIKSSIFKIIGNSAKLEKNERVEINKEFRSYHFGWIIYVWVDRNDFVDITNLKTNKIV